MAAAGGGQQPSGDQNFDYMFKVSFYLEFEEENGIEL